MNLSIIIPTIGRPILKEVINSLLLQIKKYPGTKIYISFDGPNSSQKFKDIKKQIQHPNISLLYTNKERSGASNARNIALKKALPKSDLIAFLGDDTIPSSDWLSKTLTWHKQNPDTNQAVLGRVFWVKDLENDPLHKWLDGNIQFDFHNLDKGRKPDWRHFTTSNLSLKSKAFKDNLFDTSFKGWGFEDGELGYRLYKQSNLNINYIPSIIVHHDHHQEFQKVLKNLENARKNARLLESLHPEVKLLPSGPKKLILTSLAFLSYLVPKALSNELYWWSRTKLVWLGYSFPIQTD